MRGTFRAFNGIVCTPLVRHGEDGYLSKGEHLFINVYTEMFIQVCRDYPGIPDARTLKAHEIRFFYDGLRSEIKAHTKPKG